MSTPRDIAVPSDEHLVAYLDGVLTPEAQKQIEALLAQSPAAKERLAFLQAGERPFAEALDTMLPHAPMDRLMAGLNPRTEPEQPPQRLAAGAEVHDFRRPDLHRLTRHHLPTRLPAAGLRSRQPRPCLWP